MSDRNDFFDDGSSTSEVDSKRASPSTGSRDNKGDIRTKKRKTRLLRAFLIDLALVGVGLVIFSLFHHVLPRGSKTESVKLPQATDQIAAATPNAGSSQSADSDNSQTQSAQPTTASGDWGEKFADKFAAGEPQTTENSYMSRDINVKIDKVQQDGITYYYADIYVRALLNFKTAMASEQYSTGKSAPALEISQKNNAILAVSGDYFGMRQEGIVIRNGELFRDTLFQDVLILNNDGSMETFSPEQFDLEAIKKKGAYQGWSFGPMLLMDGQAMEKFNSTVNPANPRCAIGYFEPGHYCFVLVDGRQPGYSEGMTTKQLSALFAEKGCKAAYNLDGGQSAEMVFMGKTVNEPYNGGRDVSDIVYIAER